MINSIIYTALLLMAIALFVPTKKVSKKACDLTHTIFNLSLVALVMAIIGKFFGF